MDVGDVSAALATAFSPTADPAAQQAAQAQLAAFKASQQGLQWAVATLDAAPADEPSLWLAADTVLAAARLRALSEEGALLRQSLWAWLRRDGGGGGAAGAAPHFLQSKLAAALASLAVLAWPAAYPTFWTDLQQCLAEAPGVALRVLGTLLEEFQATASATSAGMRGRMPSTLVPGIQSRYIELQPAAVSLLHSLLLRAQPSLAAAAQRGEAAELGVALEALRTLRKALSDGPSLAPSAQQNQQHQGGSVAGLLELLLSYAAALDLVPPGAPVHAACQELAAAAMDCAADLLLKSLPPQDARLLLEMALSRLPGCLACLQRHWERLGLAGLGLSPEEDPTTAACARLLAALAARQLGKAEAAGEGAVQGVLGVLGQACALMFARRSPADVAAFAEVWHAVLDHKDSLEMDGWVEEEGVGGAPQPGAWRDPYKGAILHMAHQLLPTLFSPAGQLPTAPGQLTPPRGLSAALLDCSEGSGAALEDWLQAVAGGEGGEEGEEALAADGEDEGEAEQGQQPPTSQQQPSEREAYSRLGEALISRIATTYSTPMLPLLLRGLAQHSAAFAAACQALAGTLQHTGPAAPQQQLAAAEQGLRAASLDLESSLRLVARCGSSLPLRGLGEQASLADIPMPQAGAEVPAVVTGSHSAATYLMLLDIAAGWQQAVQVLVTAGPAAASCLVLLAPVGARAFRALGALSATWLSRLMLSMLPAGREAAGGDGEVLALVQRLALGALSVPAQLLGMLCTLGGPAAGPLVEAAAAATESLVPVTSIAMSSQMKPSLDLLLGLLGSPAYQALQQAAAQGLATPLVPVKALRALWLSLSDLSLRSWSGLAASAFPAEAQAAHFGAVAAPLVGCFAEAAVGAAGGSAHSMPAGAEAAVRRAAAAANGIVLSYAGTPKHVRGILYSRLAGPLLESCLALLRQCAAPQQRQGAPALGSRAGAALLRLLSSVVDVLALELGVQGLEQLLGTLVEIFSSGGGDPSMESDLALMQLLCNVMGQGGGKHQALLLPSLEFCLGVWQRAGAAASRDVDVSHVRAAGLAALLSLLRHRWRQLSGAHVQPLATSAAAGSGPSPAAAGPLGQLHQQLHQAAAAAAGGGGAGGPALEMGPAVISRVVTLLEEYLGGAAAGQAVLAGADVRLVLEELYELQVVSRLYSTPYFASARDPVLTSLLCMLLSRLYTAAQNDLVDTLFSVAASNWSEFHLAFLPRFVEARFARLGPSERSALLGMFGQRDLDAPTFEKQALAFVNDVLFYEAALGGALG